MGWMFGRRTALCALGCALVLGSDAMAQLAPIPAAPSTPWENRMAELIEANLFDVYARDSSALTPEQIEDENETVFREQERYIPKAEDDDPTRPFYGVSYRVASDLLRYTRSAPYVSDYFYPFFNANAVRAREDIGYCFGRALFLREALLSMGVNEKAVRKIFILGDMKIWDYHVATLVYTDRGWVVLDPHYFLGLPSTPRQWFRAYNLLSAFSPQKSRVFITDGVKFTPKWGILTREELGIRPGESPEATEADWYRGYFVRVASLFKDEETTTRTLTQLGVTRLQPSRDGFGVSDERYLSQNPERYEIRDGMPKYASQLENDPPLRAYIYEKAREWRASHLGRIRYRSR